MLFPLIVTLVLVTPVAGFIAGYQCLYSHMPCVGINNVNGLNRVGIEVVEDTAEVVEDTAEVIEDTAEVIEDTVGTQEVDIGVEQDNNIIFFNDNIRIEEVDIGVE